MRRIFALSLCGAALSTAAFAQETSAPPILVPAPPASAAAASPASAPPPLRNAADKPQSSELSAMLAARMPAYTPPPPPPPPEPEGEAVDLRDVDKPKNRIIRLPKYVVHAEKPPIFREKDIYTQDGINRLAMLRYSGLGIVPGSQLNRGIAGEMYREQDRLNAMSALEDSAAAMQRGGDKEEAKFIRAASRSTYQQSLDWGAAGIPQNPSAYGAHGLK
jgi:hypothetical protein